MVPPPYVAHFSSPDEPETPKENRMTIWTRAFWAATGERAVKTFAQTAVSVLIVGNVTGVLEADWAGVGSSALLAAVISILTSVGSNAATQDGPSLTHDEQVVPRRAVEE